MTDPTPTPQAPSQGLTDARLLELARYQLGFEGPIVLDEYEKCGAVVDFEVPQLLAFARAAIAAHEAARPQPTPKEVEARFRSWWGECYPNVPAGRHTVRSHAAFALHLLGGEVAA